MLNLRELLTILDGCYGSVAVVTQEFDKQDRNPTGRFRLFAMFCSFSKREGDLMYGVLC